MAIFTSIKNLFNKYGIYTNKNIYEKKPDKGIISKKSPEPKGLHDKIFSGSLQECENYCKQNGIAYTIID